MAEFDCEETKRHVHEYLQAELTEQEMDEITAHLANCDSCEGDYDFEQVFNKVIQRSCTEAPPEELAHRIHDRIRKLLDEGHATAESAVEG
jgi:anti-sigma factor (TIGR02949 family)